MSFLFSCILVCCLPRVLRCRARVLKIVWLYSSISRSHLRVVVNTYLKLLHLDSGDYVTIFFLFILRKTFNFHYNKSMLGTTPLAWAQLHFTSGLGSSYQVVRCEHIAGKADTKPKEISSFLCRECTVLCCSLADQILSGMRQPC